MFLDAILRRLLDILGAAFGLVVLSPLLMVIGATIKLQDRGPILYRATRVGRNEKLFHLYKFRTMVLDADKLGPGITASGDRRITSIGRWLRQTKLDELPQLLNVLRGEMSLVGPRPEDPRYVAFYNDSQRTVLKVAPGITSAASLEYRYEEQMLTGDDWEAVYRTQILPAKIAIDLAYLEQRTLYTDIHLILRTVYSMK